MADVTGTVGLPSSNRGVSEFRKPDPQAGISVGIDWIAYSVGLLAVLQERGWTDCVGETLKTDLTEREAHEFAQVITWHFFQDCGFTLADEVGKGRFYQWRVPLRDGAGEYVGLIELGGANTCRKDGTVTARVELTGDGCRIYSAAGSGHAKRWLELRAKLESCAGRITRCDVAADDLAGMFPVRMAMQWREDGQFDNRGQTPKARLYDDLDSGDGKTLYIGSSSSEKQLRIYDKGKEMGDPESPWVRYEVQFKASNRKELPLDMLRDPAGYLLGAYPVLSFINAMASRIDVTQASAAATWKSCRRHLKRQYGATLSFIVKHTDSAEALQRVIETLTSPKLPTWACKEAATAWPEIVAVQPREKKL
jgi:DNA relaxase NicK